MSFGSSWEPGLVFMEQTEHGRSTLTAHRCWSMSRFRHARLEEAAIATERGKLSTVRFLSEAEYRSAGGR